MELAIVQSDNTAYVKLVNYVGKETLKKFGNDLGATNTMLGKETDCFGIISCSDMIIYWKSINDYLEHGKYGNLFKEWLCKPSFEIIDKKNIANHDFARKYGSFEIAYHEAGIVYDNNPYYLIILTQKNKVKNKNQFINMTAKQIHKIHKVFNAMHD